jgi:ribosomal protein L11 methyltransferase
VDLGTGTGILALAPKRLGARRVAAIDVDPVAISTAKTNARLNKIDNVDFKLGDVRQWKPAGTIDIVTANLFGELLIEILPKTKANQLADSLRRFARTGKALVLSDTTRSASWKCDAAENGSRF